MDTELGLVPRTELSHLFVLCMEASLTAQVLPKFFPRYTIPPYTNNQAQSTTYFSFVYKSIGLNVLCKSMHLLFWPVFTGSAEGRGWSLVPMTADQSCQKGRQGSSGPTGERKTMREFH